MATRSNVQASSRVARFIHHVSVICVTCFSNNSWPYRSGKNTKVGTPTLPEAMDRAVELMAPDRHVANRVIILVSASYRSTDVQVVKEIVSNEGIGLISVGLDGSVGAMKPLSGYDVTQIRELNGIREKVQF